MKGFQLAGIAALALCATLPAQELPSFARDADAAIQESVNKGAIPGAVLLVGHAGKTVYEKAYGSRALIPAREPMTEDTIFDLASLTKVIATTPCVMKLFEEGKIRIDDRVPDYLPGFQQGHSDITVRNLLTHFSGLKPDLDLKPEWHGYETGIEKALTDPPAGPPGVKFVYSDINFILLGEIVHKLSGEMLNRFAEETVFAPLGMKETGFLPAASLRSRIAPTEIDPDTGKPLLGVVHDPTSRFMGGVAGHAGLFSTASDLAIYAQMMLDEGRANGRQLFSPLTIRKFTSPQTPPGQPILRGFGWDIDSPFSSNRGELFPIGSFGHTGFTGTDIWIDPSSQTYMILLTNAVHPHGGKSIRSMRARVATIIAAAYGESRPGMILSGYDDYSDGERRTVARNGAVLTGLDVLAQDNFRPLLGRHVGLITNQTGLSRDGKRNIDLMHAAGVEIKAIFSPEHGFAGTEDRENVGNTRDEATGIPILSLYDGKNRRPSDAMLSGIDTLVFDIQDVGARFYTYSCTMVYSLQEAARRKIPFYVLDRPNPITGVHVEGPVLDPGLESFIGCAPVPVRHGMTLGEIAGLVNGEMHLNAELHVIKAVGWERGDWFDSTGLTWLDPSPNMRSLNAALLYPGIAMLEGSTNYSVGRGTDAPFEQIGATWIHGQDLAAFLNARYIPGIRIYPTRFRPNSSNGKGEWLNGVRFVITDRDNFDSVRFGLELAYALGRLYPGEIKWPTNRWLIGSEQVTAELEAGTMPETIMQKYRERLQRFLTTREKYLLYPGH